MTVHRQKLDGTMGQYMWCWNIGFYFAEWKVGNLKYYAVSLSPIKGKQCVYIPAGGLSALGGGVMDRDEQYPLFGCE